MSKKHKCVGCGDYYHAEDMDQIDMGVDPIDLGEFGGTMIGYLCHDCGNGGGCDCHYGCPCCQPEEYDYQNVVGYED